MADLGTLVTVVTADTSGFTVGMGQAEQAAKHFGQEVPKQLEHAATGLKAFEEKLKGGLQGLRGFREVIGLGAGIGIGRGLFEHVHEGIVKMAEGFEEGSKAGIGFFEAIGDGLKKVLGMKTATEELAESTKKYADAIDAMTKSREKTESVLNPPVNEFPFIPGGTSAVTEAEKARDAAYKTGNPKLNELMSLRKQVEAGDAGAFHKVMPGAIQGGAEIMFKEEALFALDEQIAEAKKDKAAAMQMRNADDHLAQVKKDMADANQDAAEAAAEQAILEADILSSTKSIAEADKDAAEAAKKRAEFFQKEVEEADRKASAGDTLREGLHPELRRARLRAEALEAGLSPEDLQARFAQIDAVEKTKQSRGSSYANSNSLHDILQAAVQTDGKQAQRDDWVKQTADAVVELNKKIVAPPPGQPNPWQFTG